MHTNDIYTTLNYKLSKLLFQAASWSHQDPWNKRIKLPEKQKLTNGGSERGFNKTACKPHPPAPPWKRVLADLKPIIAETKT
jgi:hypothetical protein